MNRHALLDWIAHTRGCTSYLEIGVRMGRTFDRVNVPRKVGVDVKPGPATTFLGTSDEFFGQNEMSFDLVFVDGLHHCEQVLRDIDNALRVLRPDGVIVAHDCLPAAFEHQLRQPVVSTWNGDVWKAIAVLRSWPDVDCAVHDDDFGLGVIVPRRNSAPIETPGVLDWQTYDDNRDSLLRVLGEDGIRRFIG